MYDHFFLPTSTLLCCSSGTFRLDVRLPNNVRYVQYSNQQSTLIYARRHVVKRGKTCAVKGSTLKPTSSGGLVSVEACRGKVSCLSRGENAVSCHIWQCDFDLPGGEKGKDTYTWYTLLGSWISRPNLEVWGSGIYLLRTAEEPGWKNQYHERSQPRAEGTRDQPMHRARHTTDGDLLLIKKGLCRTLLSTVQT